MIQENEIITLILAVGVLGYFAVSRGRINELPAGKTFVLAFAVLTAGWILTLLEGFFWPEALNLLEHICYAASSILLACWCWRVLADGRRAVR